MDFILFRENSFESYTLQHYIPLAIVLIAGIAILNYGRSLDREKQFKLLFYISFIPFAGTFAMYPFNVWDGSFSVREDLPFHMCRAIALAVPFVALFKSRFWIGVFYFWIFAGTLQANITPDVEFGFPHWNYFSYWMVHSFLIVIALYYILVLQIKMNWKDLRNAFIMMNVFVAFTLLVNKLMGANYMYTLEKPPVGSMLDLLGPWPVYLFTGQFLALALFCLALLPFKIKKLTAGALLSTKK